VPALRPEPSAGYGGPAEIPAAEEEDWGGLDWARVEEQAVARSSGDQGVIAALAALRDVVEDRAIAIPDLVGSARSNPDPQERVHYRFQEAVELRGRATRGTADRWAGVEVDPARWAAKALAWR